MHPMITMYRISFGKGKANSIANCHCSCSHYQDFNCSSPFVQADDRRLQHSESEQLHCSNADTDRPRLVLVFENARSDDVGQDWLYAKDDEGTKGSEPAFPRQRRVRNNKPQFLQHHNINKDLFIGGVKIRDSGGILNRKALLDIHIYNFLLLVLQKMLHFV